jgi:glycosyltransferase involved in cell wall biosynthesis
MPLVSVGMPVRNGGKMFAAALESVRAQTHRNLEIIISDNASDDETSDIARAAAAADPRIMYVRQEPGLRAYDNFMQVLSQARGEYFVWAAHDDLRSADFVERLLPPFEDPGVVLTFPDLEIMSVFGSPGTMPAYDFDNRGLSTSARMRKQALMQCFHIYGLWRTSTLRKIPKIHCPWWPDLPLMIAAVGLGTFAHVPGPKFRYLEVPKTDEERVAYQDQARNLGKIINIALLCRTTWRTVAPVAGPARAMLATVFVLEKILGFAREGLRRRARRPSSGAVPT